MKRGLLLGLVAAAALLVTSNAMAAGTILRVTIPFPFLVEGRTLPAGAYEIVQISDVVLEVRGTNREPVAPAFVTRLAARKGTSVPSEVIFDKVGDQNILSEIWYRGLDGFLVTATKGPHTHTRVEESAK